MFQTIGFSYVIFILLFLSSLSFTYDFKRFFFLSEAVWLSLLMGLLGLNLVVGNPLVLVNAFFVLVFTACEAVILASILLINSESRNNDTYHKSDNV